MLKQTCLLKEFWCNIKKLMAINGRWMYWVELSTLRCDPHAADCVYHHSCSVNFRTLRDISNRFRVRESVKRRKIGRPKNFDQDDTFDKMCLFFAENYEEQITISDLVSKMDDYLQGSKSVAYGKQYFKKRPLKRYGDNVFAADGMGFTNIVTFREKSCVIIIIHPKETRKHTNAQFYKLLQTSSKTTSKHLFQLEQKHILPHRTLNFQLLWITYQQVFSSFCNICLSVHPERLQVSGRQ